MRESSLSSAYGLQRCLYTPPATAEWSMASWTIGGLSRRAGMRSTRTRGLCDAGSRSQIRFGTLTREASHKLLSELGHLRLDHHLAVRFRRIPREVVPVILFGRVKDLGRGDLRHDRAPPETVRDDLPHDLVGGVPLKGRVVEHGRPVLSTDIVALPIECGGVVG